MRRLLPLLLLTAAGCAGAGGGESVAETVARNVAFRGNLNAESDRTATYACEAAFADATGAAQTLCVLWSDHRIEVEEDTEAPAGATSSWHWTAYDGPYGLGSPIAQGRVYADRNGQSLGGKRKRWPPDGLERFKAQGVTIQLDMSGIMHLRTDSRVDAY